MAKAQAVVVLQSMGLIDPLPHRSLTFESESDRICIGRASKRENKNLAPSRINALFDSRVMSRTHAILRVSLEKKLVYLRDPGSMHGTFVNRRQIPIDEEVVIVDGDVLTFGVEVVRGSDTFPPLAVSCVLQWSDPSYASVSQIDGRSKTFSQSSGTVIQKYHQTSNTFRVPDDDDDDIECEITAHNPVTLDLTGEQGSESDASNAGSDSEINQSVVKVPSLTTSPREKNESKEPRPTDFSAETTQEPSQAPDGSSKRGAVSLEQPLVTPRMTPPSLGYDSEDASGENQYYDEYFAHGSDEDSNVEPEDWEEDVQEDEDEEENEDEDDEEVEEEEDEDEDEEEEEDEDEDEVEDDVEEEEEEDDDDEAVEDNNIPNVARTLFEPKAQVSKESPIRISNLVDAVKEATTVEPDQSSVGVSSLEKRDELQPVGDLPGYAVDPRQIQAPAASKCTPDNQPSTADTQARGLLRQPSYFLQTMPFSQSFLSQGTNGPPSFLSSERLSDQYSTMAPNPSYIPPLAEQRPLSIVRPLDTMSLPSPYSNEASYNDGPFRQPMSGPPPTSGSKAEYMAFMDPLSPLIPRTSCAKPTTASTLGLDGWQPTIIPNVNSPKKRKASWLESESLEYKQPSSNMIPTLPPMDNPKPANEDDDLPDAQPQSLAAILDTSDSQLTTVSITENPTETKEDERPSKMVKTSHTGSLKSHAATAIFGAVVGAVGTIAALASLPDEYFA